MFMMCKRQPKAKMRSARRSDKLADPNHKSPPSNIQLRLSVLSTCFLLLGLLSSAYIAFLAGWKTRIAVQSRLEVEVSPTRAQTQELGHLAESLNVDNEITHPARLPSGHHLFVDMQNVNANFLSSETLLAQAMMTFVEESQLAMLSYHCHPLPLISPPMGGGGVTCVGVLLDGYLTLHTWPGDDHDGDGGVILLDLFTSHSSNSSKDLDSNLIAMLPLMQQLFAIPTTTAPSTLDSLNGNDNKNQSSSKSKSKPKIHWGHKLRGFRSHYLSHGLSLSSKSNSNDNYQRDKNPYDQELGEDILRRRDFDHKRALVSTKTKYQHVDIYELVHEEKGTVYAALGLGGIQSTPDDGLEDHEYKIVPDRVLFIDGVLQSSLYGEAEYHEALVHPAMLSHPDPRRVAIIGGGEGATLREVLKHNTVQEAVMIEIDGELTDLSRTYLPEWSDCSDMIGSEVTSSISCFDDPRASVYFEDAFGYFLDRFGEEDDDLDDEDDDGIVEEDELFDVIIMDALDPDDFGDFVDKLYNDTQFIASLYDGLTENGVIVVQVGAIPQHIDPPDELSSFYNRAHMLNKLEEVGFESIHVYDEGHSHFYTPWQFLVAFKDSNNLSNRASWYRSSAEIEIELHQRLSKTKSGERNLRYFDGSTMSNYQMPPKVVETNYCRKEEATLHCHPEFVNDYSTSQVRDWRSMAVDPALNQGLESTMVATQGFEPVPANCMNKNDHILSSTWSSILDLHNQTGDRLSSAFAFIEGGCDDALKDIDLNNIPVYSPVIDRRRLEKSVGR